jgi:purine-binding chemotaxis protein CheW
MESGRFVLFRVRRRLCAVPVAHVAETMRPLPIEPVAGQPAFVLGLAVIRGSPLPVVDAGALFDGVAEPVAAHGSSSITGTARAARFVVLALEPRRVALLVDEVVGVSDLGGAALAALPGLLREAKPDVVEAVGALDRELLLVLRVARLMPTGPPPPVHLAPGNGA